MLAELCSENFTETGLNDLAGALRSRPALIGWLPDVINPVGRTSNAPEMALGNKKTTEDIHKR